MHCQQACPCPHHSITIFSHPCSPLPSPRNASVAAAPLPPDAAPSASGALQFPGVLWAAGDLRLLDRCGWTRVKQHKRERISRPPMVVAVMKRKPRAVVEQVQVAEAALEAASASAAVELEQVVAYKTVEEVIEVVECEDVSTVTIYIVMHNGKRVRAPFKRSDTVQQLRDHIAAHTPQEGAVFTLWGGRPRAMLTDMAQQLTAGNLMQAPVQQRVPNAVLQAAVRRLVGRARYLQRMETEASVMKLSATESRLRRLTEEMRNHSTVMQEAHELEVAEEERQARLLAVIEEAAAQKRRQGRRASKASASSGSRTQGSGRMEDDDFSEDWGSSASEAEAASDADDEKGPHTPVKSSAAELSAHTPSPRATQLPLSPKALQRLHSQVAGLNLLSPLRRRMYTSMRGGSAAGQEEARDSPSSVHKASPSSEQLPSRISGESPRAPPRANAVSDAERLKRMWNEQRAAAQLRAQGQLPLEVLAPEVTRIAAAAGTATTHVIPSAAAAQAHPAANTMQELSDYDDLRRFSYRASARQPSEAELSRRRLRM
jgi:hypothetical protein